MDTKIVALLPLPPYKCQSSAAATLTISKVAVMERFACIMNSVIIIKGTLKEILVCVLPAFHTIKTTCLLSLPPPPPPSPPLPSHSVDSEMLVSAPTPHSNWTITACTLTTRQLTANGQVEV